MKKLLIKCKNGLKMGNPIIEKEYQKAKNKNEIKEIYYQYGFPISAMIVLRRIDNSLSLKEIHDEVYSWKRKHE
jgi:hypothetical protein